MDYLEHPEFEAIMAMARKYSDRVYTVMAIMGYAGLRPSEALALKLKDVWVMGHIVTELTLPGTNTKTKTGRDVPIPEILFEILYRYITRHSQLDQPSSWLFPGTGESHLTIRALQYTIRRLGYASIHRHVTPKAFRHSYATFLARKAPIRAVQQALGHAHLSSTEVYTHNTKNDLKNAISEVFDNKKTPTEAEIPSPLTYPPGKE